MTFALNEPISLKSLLLADCRLLMASILWTGFVWPKAKIELRFDAIRISRLPCGPLPLQKISSQSNQKAICQMIFVGKAIAVGKQTKVYTKLSKFLHRYKKTTRGNFSM